MIAKCPCEHCGVNIEFSTGEFLSGSFVPCPKCGKETPIFVSPQAKPTPNPATPIEAKCSCQRCGQPIAFPVDLHNTEVECPHCQRTTTLLIPSPSARVRKADSLPPPPIRAESAADEEESQSTLTCCLILSVLIPFVGFFCGVWLMTKKETGYGVACIGTSIFVVIMVLVFMSS